MSLITKHKKNGKNQWVIFRTNKKKKFCSSNVNKDIKVELRRSRSCLLFINQIDYLLDLD